MSDSNLETESLDRICAEGLNKTKSLNITQLDFRSSVMLTMVSESFLSYLKSNRNIFRLGFDSCVKLEALTISKILNALEDNLAIASLEFFYVSSFPEAVERELVSFVQSKKSMYSLSVPETLIHPDNLGKLFSCPHLGHVMTTALPSSVDFLRETQMEKLEFPGHHGRVMLGPFEILGQWIQLGHLRYLNFSFYTADLGEASSDKEECLFGSKLCECLCCQNSLTSLDLSNSERFDIEGLKLLSCGLEKIQV
jgi:hypothetical protein